MVKTRKGTATYERIGTENDTKSPVPILAPGIGTRISAVSSAIGSRKDAALVAQVSTDSLQRYIREENMPPFDVAARLCAAAGVRLDWLVTAQEPMRTSENATQSAVSHALRRDDLTMALQLAAEALEDKYLPPPKHAELVTLIYELLEEGLPQAKVLRFARAASS